MKGCESIKLTYTDIKHKLRKDSVVEFDTCIVGGHNYNGKVERLSVLQWETVSSVIANTINDLPIGLINIISDYENMD